MNIKNLTILVKSKKHDGGVTMDFLELAKARYSVRKFSQKQVETQKLDRILEAGRLAPTAANAQPQRILVLDSEASLNKLKTCTAYHFNAPLVLLICYDNAVSWKRPYDSNDSGYVDASIVTTHIMLETANLGLGSTWVGHFDPAVIHKAFALPATIVPVALLPIGYPDETSSPNPNHNKRYDKDKTIFYNAFAASE
jgi:nitroreductase